DLAEASVRLAGWDTWNLVRVDQLARFLRPKLEAARTPAEKIKILNTWILKDHVVFTNLSAPDVQLSFLPYVFSQDAGNCVGYTTLYLALGQRLGLPLHGVLIPGHAFVRWEDGTFRRNIEPMFRGTEVGNAYYRASPHQLRNRTPREVLSVVLSNAAALSLRFGNYESAREECEVALRLDPSNAAARNNYVLCMLHASLDERERIDTLLEELRTRSPDDAEPWLLQSSIHAAFNEHDEALQAAHEAVRREESDRTRGWRARCYARLGQLDRAKNDLQRLENAEPFGDLRLELRVRDNPAGAVQSITQSLATAGHDRLRRITRAAEVLLEIREPAQALVVLDMGREHSERSLKDEFIQTGGVAAPDMLTREGARRRWHLVRAKALHAEGRKSEARAALATAKKHGHGGRLTLEVERLLESR
ncbi:MAG: transglutaminase family protein, partial [Planctomycetota bacterium]